MSKRREYLIRHPKNRSLVAVKTVGDNAGEVYDRVKLSKKGFPKGRVHHVRFTYKGSTKRALAVELKKQSKKTSRVVLIRKKRASTGEFFGKKTGNTWKGNKKLVKVAKQPVIQKKKRSRIVTLKTKNGSRKYRLFVKKWKVEQL